MKLKNRITLFLLLTGTIFFLFSCESNEHGLMEKQFNDVTTNSDSIQHEMKYVLDQEYAALYPLSIDSVQGGFFSDINYKWELDGTQDKMIVTQARHVWSTANAAVFFKNNISYKNISAHGVDFLMEKMWDKEFGGFYNLVDRQGNPIPENGQLIKQAYGNAFAIYGLAAYYQASADTSALEFAKESFRWLDKHSYDPVYGGYFQFLSREGTPFTEGYRGTPPKDYNSMIHILECFTELYHVWKDDLLRQRLQSMLTFIRDTATAEKGYLKLYFKRDWMFVPNKDNYQLDHISFGHDVETAYLLIEASEALGLKNDTTTIRVAKRMVDHALANGWDKKRGGIYDGGYYYPGNKNITIIKETKEWWSQVEAFNAFLLMAQLFPNEPQYYEKFGQQWHYCKNNLIDNERGGWYWGGIDIEPDKKYSPKSSIWKCNYHTSRSLINCINRLKHMKEANTIK
jgi:cellobiose epimerase